MKGFKRVLPVAALVAVIPFSGANAVPVTHNVAVNSGETKTWQGTAAPGVNPNYNGLHESLGPSRNCTADVKDKCEYALVAVTNPVPADDADGKLRKAMTVTINNYTLPSPLTDFALTAYETDATGSVRGAEIATSDNTDVPDDDESVPVQVTTTVTEPTKYFLIEVAYFANVASSYTGTVKF